MEKCRGRGADSQADGQTKQADRGTSCLSEDDHSEDANVPSQATNQSLIDCKSVQKMPIHMEIKIEN